MCIPPFKVKCFKCGKCIILNYLCDCYLQIFVNTPENEVQLLIGQSTAEVRLYQTQIQRYTLCHVLCTFNSLWKNVNNDTN